jgi:hypothetical protein
MAMQEERERAYQNEKEKANPTRRTEVMLETSYALLVWRGAP